MEVYPIEDTYESAQTHLIPAPKEIVRGLLASSSIIVGDRNIHRPFVI